MWFLESSPSKDSVFFSPKIFGSELGFLMAEAMDIGDEVMENSIPSLIKDSLDSIQKGNVGSPEDIAWVDSCLIKESDISDDNWNSLKAAVLEILDFQPESLSSSSRVSNGLHWETDIEILPSSEETEPKCSSIREELETTNDDIPIHESANDLQSFPFEGNPFLPGYKDDLEVTENLELGVNMGSWASDIEPSTEDIFRVWNLEVPVEEDDFVKQLNNALEDGLPQSLPSSFAASDVWKNLEETSVDDLVAGIADLSLNQIVS